MLQTLKFNSKNWKTKEKRSLVGYTPEHLPDKNIFFEKYNFKLSVTR